MKRFLPRSLAAQMLVVLGLALLVAQLVNFALILNERQKLSLAQNEGPAITRFVQIAADFQTVAPGLRDAFLADFSQRGVRFYVQRESGVAASAREQEIEQRLTTALGAQNLKTMNVRAAFVLDTDFAGTRRDRPPGPPPRKLVLAVQQADGAWLIGQIPVPPRDEWLALRLAAATVLLYGIVLGVSAWAALRLARPLRDLTCAANAFKGRDMPAIVAPSGPEDLRHAIEAFNAMNGRVVALLDEKDRMLGALGHDLRTPLASLRIRIEGMEPPEERDAAIAKINEMSGMVEEILVLARSGRARGPVKRMDVTALVETLTDEQRELGHDVSMVTQTRIVAEVQPDLLRRAVTNLLDNAVTYGGGATVSVTNTVHGVEIRVSDEGPGIPAEQMKSVLEPFYRVESSRNRHSGGAGLGLAIARSVAENHGGSLRLEPADPAKGGLAAIITLPVQG